MARKLLRPFRAINSFLLVLVLLGAASIPEPAHGFVLSADRSGGAQSRSQESARASEVGHQSDRQRKPKEDEGSAKAGGNSVKSGGSGWSGASPGGSNPACSDSAGSNKGTGAAGPKGTEPPLAASASPVSDAPSTPASSTSVSVSNISIDDPCRISGTVSFSALYTGRMTLRLTYHVTGSPEFIPTGSTWSYDFNGQTTSTSYLLSPVSPSTADPKERVNSYRVEIASADPVVTNMTAKSPSFYCGNQVVEPSPTPTVTWEPTVATPATPIRTPSATPSVTPTTSDTTASRSSPTPAGTPGPTSGDTSPAAPSHPSGPAAASGDTSGALQSATPTPTNVALSGATSLVPDNSANADPGTSAVYRHTVTNLGATLDVKEIVASSSLEWPVTIFAADGTTPLIDSNQNGTVDTGPIGPGQSTDIVIKVAVPLGAMRGTRDVTTITASSASNPGPTGSATASDTTTVNGVITLSLSTSTVAFGSVSPAGSLEAGTTDTSSTEDDLGATYVKSRALQITVYSNAVWRGTVQARENSGTASTIKIADGDLRWRLQGDQGWTPMATSSLPFAEGAPGQSSYVYDYELRILWDDEPGTFSSVVTYDATQ